MLPDLKKITPPRGWCILDSKSDCVHLYYIAFQSDPVIIEREELVSLRAVVSIRQGCEKRLEISSYVSKSLGLALSDLYCRMSVENTVLCENQEQETEAVLGRVFETALENLKAEAKKLRPEVKGDISIRQIAACDGTLYGADLEGRVFCYDNDEGGWRRLKMRELKKKV